MTIPLFEVAPARMASRVSAARLSARGLELVMAGRCAQLDAADSYGRDIVWLSVDWHSAFSGPAEENDAEAVHRMLQTGELVLGAPVDARLAGVVHHAHLVIGPVEVSDKAADSAGKPTEQDRLDRIAQRHGIDASALAELIDESRSEARLRRRRLSDLRLMQHVAAIGALVPLAEEAI